MNEIAPGTPRVGRLDTPADVRREAARLYRAARRGDVEASDASKLATVLTLIIRSLEVHEVEARLRTLETQQ